MVDSRQHGLATIAFSHSATSPVRVSKTTPASKKLRIWMSLSLISSPVGDRIDDVGSAPAAPSHGFCASLDGRGRPRISKLTQDRVIRQLELWQNVPQHNRGGQYP